MLDEDRFRRKTKRVRLSSSSLDKFRRSDEDPGNPPLIQIIDVVHTARRAATSIGERFDENVTLRGNLLLQEIWRRARKGGFHISPGGQPLSL